MREIKFRAWDKLRKRWLPDPFLMRSDDGTPCYLHWEWIEDMSNAIVTQFTGLKDRKGVEIYEGDILNCTCYKTPRYVEWLDEGAGFIFRDKNGDDWWSPNCDYVGSCCEVIGNTYENPELVK